MGVESRFAARIRKVKPSSTLAITSKAKKLKSEGCDVVTFAAGEPDFDTPDFIKKAAVDAINAGFTKYTPTTGTPELKKLICEKFKKDNGLTYVPEQVIVSCGAKHSIYNALTVLADKGDEVIIPAPYWVSYPEMVHLCEAVPVFIETKPAHNFKIDAASLSRAITPRSKVLILNSPSNPTGCVYTKDELEAIAQVCVKKNLFVISDEIYEKIIFDGLKHVSIASLGDEINDLTVTVNGLSKSHSMTGWRIGYLAGPKDLVAAIARLQDHSTSNPNSIAQKAAVAALQASDDFAHTMRAEFERRRDHIIKRLRGHKRLGYVKPQGAFYVFVDITKTGLDSMTFATRLLDEAFVALIPGESFGRDDFVRISFACSMAEIDKGIDRIEEWLEKKIQ